MKPKVLKYIMLVFGNIHGLLMKLLVMFMRLAQMEQQNGELYLHNLQQAWNHFCLLIIFLVLEDHEMMC